MYLRTGGAGVRTYVERRVALTFSRLGISRIRKLPSVLSQGGIHSSLGKTPRGGLVSAFGKGRCGPPKYFMDVRLER